jgi:hypothetical protein
MYEETLCARPEVGYGWLISRAQVARLGDWIIGAPATFLASEVVVAGGGR